MEKVTRKERTYSREIGKAKVKVEVPLDGDTCLLCANDIAIVAIGACGHKVCCYLCILRLRWVLNQNLCPVCKGELKELIITKSLKEKYEELIDKKSTFIQDEKDSLVYFDNQEAYDKMTRMRGYFCLFPGCGKNLRDLKGLQDHLKASHNRVFCEVCFKNRPVFIGEQLMYPEHKLKEHMKYGERRGDISISPHPYCHFCDKHFYTEESLKNHISKTHYFCHLCSEKYKHIIYKDYTELELHFQKSHFLCQNPLCKQKCFVVFGTIQELHIHNHKDHEAYGSVKNITLDALKAGLFSGAEEIPSKGEAFDGIGTDYSRFFSSEYYIQLQEEYDKRNAAAEKASEDLHQEQKSKGKYTGGVHYVKKEKPKYDPPEKPAPSSSSVPSSSAPVTKENCILNLRNELFNFIKEKLDKLKPTDTEFIFKKDQYFQLTRLIDSMGTESLMQCEFIMNFGIPLQTKKYLSYLLKEKQGLFEDPDEIASWGLRNQLIIFKYFDLALQKLQKKFIKFELDDINEDLLADFKKTSTKAKGPKLAVDYRDALKPSINFEDKKLFPEFQAIAKPAPKTQSATIWQQLEKKSIPATTATTHHKPKKQTEEEFPAFPESKPPKKVEEKKVQEIKKLPPKQESDKDAFPTFQEATIVSGMEGMKKKGPKKQKKQKKQKVTPEIKMGFL